MAAVQVRVHYNTVADFDAVLVVLPGWIPQCSQLVADDAGIRNQTIGAAESTDVTAADAGGDHLDQSLAGFRTGLFNVKRKRLSKVLPNLIAFMMK